MRAGPHDFPPEGLSSAAALLDPAMAGLLPHPRTAPRRAQWPRSLHRAALFLGVGSALYWASFALGHQTLWSSGSGAVYLDIILAWLGILVQVAAWPNLWEGLRDLRARRPRDASPVLAWRAFLLGLVLAGAAAVVLPVQYHALASTDAWLLVLYVTVFPFVAWTSVPLLALHGILFGRVAGYLGPRPRHVADLGAGILFAVAAATTALVLEHPGTTAFLDTWRVGQGLLPSAAFAGYALIAVGMTMHAVPATYHVRPGVAEGGR